MKTALKFVWFLLDPTVGTFARSFLRVVISLGVVFGLDISVEIFAGIMVSLEAALQAFAQIPWARYLNDSGEDVDENGDIVLH